MEKTIEAKIKDLPALPGVYVYKDARGAVLYVGKAVNLHNRVRSYFNPTAKHSTRIENMVAQIKTMDYTVCNNELESLILENNFIKQLKPKYNVMLRDDKNYQFLKIDLKEEIPTISFERKIEDARAKYFGPYTSGASLKETLRLLRRIFPYCANSVVGVKPCFYYHIGKCPGVCFGKITPETYREEYVARIIEFLEGRQSQILKQLQVRMKTLARGRNFEKAAKVRDQIFALNRVLERQRVVYQKKVSQDVWGIYSAGNLASLNLFLVRDGKLTRKENFILENAKNASFGEILESFLPKYYLDSKNYPKELLTPVGLGPNILLPFKPKQITPQRGPKQDLMLLSEANAKQFLEAQSDKQALEDAKSLASLKELQRVLGLNKLPDRIEGFDISNIQGTNPVGSMVVFDFARPKKSDYRKFKIRGKDTPDDFAMMSEMITRRLKRSLDGSRTAWPLPNLILIDGGKGQLNAALSAIKKTGADKLHIPILGLAKRLEEIFLPGRRLPIILPVNSAALFLLQRVRDEAHRFGVTFHRQLRSNKSLSSALDEISGLGPAKKQKLLKRFLSLKEIKKASLTDIGAVVGNKLAEKLKASLP